MNDLLPSLKASLATLLVLCGACSPVPQQPLSSGMVRINLAADVGNDVRAYRVDGELTQSIRFGDLAPGAHSLQVRYHFEVPGGATGELLGGNFRTCVMEVDYADFGAGKQYLLKTERRGWVSVGGLYDQQTQKKVASAEEVRCGPGL
tara:strand:- start:1285 stop:1728 length:444 start_codon:yes stop_codon:yes gene_type:complete